MPYSTLRAAVTTMRASPDCSSGMACLPISREIRTLSAPSCRICAPFGSASENSGTCLPPCSRTICRSSSLRAGRLDRHLEGTGDPDDLLRLVDLNGGSRHTPGIDECAPDREDGHQHETEQKSHER